MIFRWNFSRGSQLKLFFIFGLACVRTTFDVYTRFWTNMQCLTISKVCLHLSTVCFEHCIWYTRDKLMLTLKPIFSAIQDLILLPVGEEFLITYYIKTHIHARFGWDCQSSSKVTETFKVPTIITFVTSQSGIRGTHQ